MDKLVSLSDDELERVVRSTADDILIRWWDEYIAAGGHDERLLNTLSKERLEIVTIENVEAHHAAGFTYDQILYATTLGWPDPNFFRDFIRKYPITDLDTLARGAMKIKDFETFKVAVARGLSIDQALFRLNFYWDLSEPDLSRYIETAREILPPRITEIESSFSYYLLLKTSAIAKIPLGIHIAIDHHFEELDPETIATTGDPDSPPGEYLGQFHPRASYLVSVYQNNEEQDIKATKIFREFKIDLDTVLKANEFRRRRNISFRHRNQLMAEEVTRRELPDAVVEKIKNEYL